MSSDFSPEISRELLDDFYAECDELLGGIRSSLANLEQALPSSDATAVANLFRHIHTLKGNAAIVGLRPLEQLAHQMEEILRAVTRNTAKLTPDDVDVLLAGTQRIEQLVAAHRQGRAAPAIDDIQHLLANSPAARALSQPATASGSASPTQPDSRRVLLQANFQPTKELNKRGINVTVVRARLAELGEIVQASPTVKPDGTIVFSFTVAAREGVTNLDRWSGDGLHLTVAADSTPGTNDLAPSDILSLAPSHLVRVDLSRLDDLMRITGELVIQRSRLEERLNQNASVAVLKETNVALARSLRELRSAISRVRMVPVAEIFTRMPFAVRDLMRGSDKVARVTLEGQQTEVDKYLVERLKEPLLHLVRNAFSHGIETADERQAAGKPRQAEIVLRAKSIGDSVEIRVRDDGRGIDTAKVAARARNAGLALPETIDAEAVLQLLCTPGFSTRDAADLSAGRGVGMAVVAETVRELGGTLSLETQLGAGTEFVLRLPLSLSIADALIVQSAGHTAAIPQGMVQEIFQCAGSTLRTIARSEIVPYRGGVLPITRLNRFFGKNGATPVQLTVLVIISDRGLAGLVVDRVLTQREIVVRTLADPLLRVPGISGAAELGDGRPILILDPIKLTYGASCPAGTMAEPISPAS